MKALVLTEKNNPLIIKEVPDLRAGENEAIVKIHSAALNHRDLWIRKGQYAGLKYPIILGSDGSGVVIATGTNSDAHWIGKEVIIYPALNWGAEQSHQHPENFKILGLPDDGTFAEFVKIPASNLALKPKHLSFEEAAALPLAGLTAYRALIKRANLQNGEKVLITGIGGGVALFALQYAKATNADIYVTSGDEGKIAKAITLGAAAGANYKNENWIEILQTQAGSFNVIIDGAAGNGLDNLLNLAKPGGRIVLYGATKGNPSNITARRIFWKQLNVLGSTMGSPADFKEMIDFVEKNKIKPVIDNIFSFENGEDAMQRMNNSHQFGKIVISIVRSKK
jgi:zinc-binding alcohol dehydrogenase/oxidoreductase